ncbi:MAG: hypothetical protein WBC51_00580 [Vicinamibacterales bacterium]
MTAETMFKVWTTRAMLVAVLAVGVAACDDETPTSPNNPRDPVTETFTGQVTPNGAKTHTFSTASSGTVTATLKEVAPDSALVIGFNLGNWDGSSCQLVFSNTQATKGAVLSGTVSGIGNLCVIVNDVGNITDAPASYTVEVVHP